ncbi:MAG: glucose ABC transporter permease GlcT [Vulcanisaeta sp.]|uniref:glucose ABC transporter permease GlcT n=1 Tax=Vulcanisaeta sp. TaxID=2020871 RepID=UPI003D0AE4D0
MIRQSLIMAIPTLFFGGIIVFLLIWNFVISLENWSLFNPFPKFTGLLSYLYLFTQNFFYASIEHTILFTVGLVAIGNILGLLLAALLYFLPNNTQRAIYLSIFIYPIAIPPTATALVWLWLFNPQIGIDWLLSKLYLPSIPWFATPLNTQLALVLVEVWAYTGLAVLFYLASFLSVDRSIIEAARLDGASSMNLLFRVLLPNSMNGFIITTALLFLFSFRIFDIPFIMSGSATSPTLMTLVTYIYYLFAYSEYFSVAAALATLVAVIAAIVIIPYALLGLKRWVFRR